MKSLTYDQKRLVAAIYSAVMLVAAGNYFLDWGLFGEAGRKVLSIVTFLGVIAMARFGSRLQREAELLNQTRRDAESEAERVRDKSQDAEETERLRKALGMPPNSSERRHHD